MHPEEHANDVVDDLDEGAAEVEGDRRDELRERRQRVARILADRAQVDLNAALGVFTEKVSADLGTPRRPATASDACV